MVVLQDQILDEFGVAAPVLAAQQAANSTFSSGVPFAVGAVAVALHDAFEAGVGLVESLALT
ncbi:MAG: hypothetical protein V3V05_01520 [Pontiella sp.]